SSATRCRGRCEQVLRPHRPRGRPAPPRAGHAGARGGTRAWPAVGQRVRRRGHPRHGPRQGLLHRAPAGAFEGGAGGAARALAADPLRAGQGGEAAPRARAALPLRRFLRPRRAHRDPAAREPAVRGPGRRRPDRLSRMRRPPRRKLRPLDGILLLDKPSGPSSNQALQRVKQLYRAAKAGHTGSLDPLATGLLPVCLGEATKIAGHLLGSRKAYRTVAVLGATTDTDDADGQVLLERPVPALGESLIEAALAPLRGRIAQRAPIYSALKSGGEPLYARARRGEAIEAPVREVEVHRLELLRREGATLELEIECGSGTYVRSLVRDLGEALGCGAHVAQLRRLWVEPFHAPRMHTLE